MNFGKANHHHNLAGMHLSKGDAKQAAHHLGHALSALKTTRTTAATAAPSTPAPTPAAKPMSLQDHLAKMKGC